MILLQVGSKETKASKTLNVEAVFKTYSPGVSTNRDIWAYNFNKNFLISNIKRTIDFYNEQIFKWFRTDRKGKIDDFVAYDDTKISWSRDLKLDLKRGKEADFNQEKIRKSLYRPFTEKFLFFDRVLNEEVYGFPAILPDLNSEKENFIFCIGGYGRKEFSVLATKILPNLNFY